MKLKQIKDNSFNGSFKLMAVSAKLSIQSLRNMISADREALELANGNFILTNDRSRIFEIEKADYSNHKTRLEGHYKLEADFDVNGFAYWTGTEWLLIGDEDEYSDDELNIKSIELVELKTQ